MTISIAYTGAVLDDETGLYYMNARYYDPATGRFISMDSYRGDGESFWHLYAYCDGDPVNCVDPSGNVPCFFVFGVAIPYPMTFTSIGAYSAALSSGSFPLTIYIPTNRGRYIRKVSTEYRYKLKRPSYPIYRISKTHGTTTDGWRIDSEAHGNKEGKVHIQKNKKNGGRYEIRRNGKAPKAPRRIQEIIKQPHVQKWIRSGWERIDQVSRSYNIYKQNLKKWSDSRYKVYKIYYVQEA